MVLKLHGMAQSTCTTRVGTALNEKKVPFEFVPVELFKGVHKQPEYLEKQPFGQIPYIDDDDYILFESRAICHYIALKYSEQGTPLYPTDLKAIGLVEQASSIEVANFEKFASSAAVEMVFELRYHNIPADKAVYEPLLASLDTKLQVYNVILGKQKYLGDDEISLPDLFHLPCGALLEEGGSDMMSKYPNVDRWFKSLTGRPSWQAVKDGFKSTTF